MVHINNCAGEWRVVRYYAEEKGRLKLAFGGMHSHVMIERGRRCMIVPRNEVRRMRDTVRAYEYERGYKEAMLRAERGEFLDQGEVNAIFAYVELLKNALHTVNRALSEASRCSGSEFWDERGAIDGSLRMIDRMEAHGTTAWDALRSIKSTRSDAPIPTEGEAYDMITLAVNFDFGYPGTGVCIIDAKSRKILFTAEENACDDFDCEELARAIITKAPYVIVPVAPEE